MASRRAEDFQAVFGALAHETRREILVLLAQLGDELPSGYLAQRVQGSWPTTTRHLGVLLEAGLVHVTREGRSSTYRLDRDRIREVLLAWLAAIDERTPKKTWAPSGPRTVNDLQKPKKKAKRK